MKLTKKIKHYFKRITKVQKLENEYSLLKLSPLKDLIRVPMQFNVFEKPKVSIIIPFYNEEVYTWNCLSFLNKFLSDQIPYEIILIDDKSPEKYDFSLIDGISIHRNTENLGFLKNINKGIQLAKGEFIYILNNDTEVQKDFLEELLFVFENFENVGAVGSKLINPNRSLQEAGSLFMANCNIRQIVRKRTLYNPDINYIKKVDYCSGCSLLFKRYDDNGQLNLLDEQFAPAYFEETDFCFTLKYIQKKGIYYTPFSEVVHYNGITYNSPKNTTVLKSNKKEILFAANLKKFKQKWQAQIDAIKETTIDGRIQEIYHYKSVVFFTSHIPEHDRDSGSNRLKEIIECFIHLNYHVTLISKYPYIENEYTKFYQKLGVNVFYEYKKHSGYQHYLISQKINAEIAWFYGPNEFKNYHNSAKKLFPKAKMVYDMVDIHHIRYQRALEHEPSRSSFKRRYLKYKTLETKASQVADFVITISDAEAEYMKTICDKDKIITLSNIHYPKTDFKKILPFEERKDILFIGSKHTPNIDAIYYLFNEIMPIVWEKIPEIKVNIIGNVNEKIKDINHPNFIFQGYVPEIEYFFTSNKLMVAPLRYGAGVKGKIGQAFEYYLPVVTSTIGAEGMNIKNNTNALIEDTKEGFAKSIIDLYTNKELWLHLQNHSEDSLNPFSKEKLKETILEISKKPIYLK